MRISDWSSDVCSSDLQLAHERDVTREFMLAQALAREVLELVDIRIVRGARGNDESLRDLAANRIGNTDHGGLLHVRMLEQRCLDLAPAHRPAGGDDTVVAPAAGTEIPWVGRLGGGKET